jgi:hypothetical protein
VAVREVKATFQEIHAHQLALEANQTQFTSTMERWKLLPGEDGSGALMMEAMWREIWRSPRDPCRVSCIFVRSIAKVMPTRHIAKATTRRASWGTTFRMAFRTKLIQRQFAADASVAAGVRGLVSPPEIADFHTKPANRLTILSLETNR